MAGLFEGVRAERVAPRWQTIAEIVDAGAVWLDRVLRSGRSCRRFDLLCHHAARVGDYRSPDFDVPARLPRIPPICAPCSTIRSPRASKGVVLTGSVFEQDEGAGEEPLHRFLALRAVERPDRGRSSATGAARSDCHYGKFVIPNPFGPLEEPRFCAYLVRTWKKGEVAEVQHPGSMFATISTSRCSRRLTPNSSAETARRHRERRSSTRADMSRAQGAFAERFAAAMRPRLGMPCGLDYFGPDRLFGAHHAGQFRTRRAICGRLG